MNKTIYNISQFFVQKGIKRIVMSPGSRNAPLSISFSRNPQVETFNVVDERSAGFIALGMAIKSKKPVALSCTSGSALLNYSPAVSEAYYQQIPLIIISADRPQEWLNQRDGQTINQNGALSNFVKSTFTLPSDLSHEDAIWEFERKINEAINLSVSAPAGPVHINVPFREPFYPSKNEAFSFEKVRLIEQPALSHDIDLSSLAPRWAGFKKRLIVVGQEPENKALNEFIERLANIPVVADVISNIQSGSAIRTHDLFLANLNEDQSESLRPELLITTGKSVISKNLKIFLRKYTPLEHWHFEDTDQVADTFKSLTHHFRAPLEQLLNDIVRNPSQDDFSEQVERNYNQNWNILESKTRASISSEIPKQAFSEVSSFHTTIGSLPSGIDLHLANSMAVRYVNFFQQELKDAEVFANRGTSGIDGSNGAAVGNAIIGEKPVVLLTGDLSFFYDRNAFFHNHKYNNLKIIVFNNQGGGIFRLIKGPSDLPELEQHFETRHNHSASFTAAEYGFDYYKSTDKASLTDALNKIFTDDKTPKLLEVFTEPETNSECFKSMKQTIFEAINNIQ
ncbi:MAG: 2-succinyl-5-enolpyruvyl-6-hydroxy-3-cyclohexene-1-carboxylic-acid synthase [Cyclobacteriaceae bacterium]